MCSAILTCVIAAWAPSARGLVSFLAKTRQKPSKSRKKCGLRTRVFVLGTRVPNFGHRDRKYTETPVNGRLDLIFSKFSLPLATNCLACFLERLAEVKRTALLRVEGIDNRRGDFLFFSTYLDSNGDSRSGVLQLRHAQASGG